VFGRMKFHLAPGSHTRKKACILCQFFQKFFCSDVSAPNSLSAFGIYATTFVEKGSERRLGQHDRESTNSNIARGEFEFNTANMPKDDKRFSSCVLIFWFKQDQNAYFRVLQVSRLIHDDLLSSWCKVAAFFSAWTSKQ
jgi:hypothetical protein